MTLHLAPTGPLPKAPSHAPSDTAPSPLPDAPIPRLDQLDPVATQALRLLRLWSWGAVHRGTLRLAAATQYGTARGLCVIGAFEGLFARLEAAATPPLAIRPPDSARLTDDELWLLRLVAAAGSRGPGALPPLLAGRIAPGREAALADSLHGFVRTLTTALDGRGPRTGPPCPAACPMQDACRPASSLRLVD